MTEEENTTLSAILNCMGIIEIALVPILFIVRIWCSDEWIGKAILSDVIAFIGTLFIYYVMCYHKKDEE